MIAFDQEYEWVRSRATWTAWRQGSKRHQADIDDRTQETFARFLEKGLQDQIDSTRGSARSLLSGFLGFVEKESMRANGRETPVPSLEAAEPVVDGQEPLEGMLANEKVELVAEWIGKLTETERLGLVRFYGPRIEPLTSRDYTAKHRSIKKLRKWASRIGLLEGPVRPKRRKKRAKKSPKRTTRRSVVAERGITSGLLSMTVDMRPLRMLIARGSSVEANPAIDRTAS